jgi:hypothetical protein
LISAGSIHLLGSGLDSSLQRDSQFGDVYLNFQGGLALFGSGTQTSYGAPSPPLITGIAVFNSTASINAFNGKLGVTLSGSGGNLGGQAGGGDASVAWHDGLTLFWNGKGPAPILPSYLNIGTVLDAQLSTSIDGITGISSIIYSDASISVSFNQNSLSWSVDKNAVFNPTGKDLTLTPNLNFTETLDQGGHTSLTWGVSASVSTTIGTGSVNAGDTFKMVSITLPDGSTPESEGWAVVFDSGIPSPNLSSAVPEPSSLTVVCIGVVGGLVYAWRRRKQTARGLPRTSQ